MTYKENAIEKSKSAHCSQFLDFDLNPYWEKNMFLKAYVPALESTGAITELKKTFWPLLPLQEEDLPELPRKVYINISGCALCPPAQQCYTYSLSYTFGQAASFTPTTLLTLSSPGWSPFASQVSAGVVTPQGSLLYHTSQVSLDLLYASSLDPVFTCS